MLTNYPTEQWILFQNTPVPPGGAYIEMFGDKLPIGSVYIEPIIITAPAMTYEGAPEEVFWVKEGAVTTLKGYFRAYVNVDQAFWKEATSREEAVRDLRQHLSLDYASVHRWRAMTYEQYWAVQQCQ